MPDEYFYYKKDRLNQLRGFCFTVQNKSIMKAASIMHVEPGTVSKQIQALERDLNISLFDRNFKKQRLTITEKGKEFYKSAISVIQNMESLFKYYSDNNMEYNKNEVRVSAHHTIFVYLMPKYIKMFREKFPKSEFYLDYSSLESALKDLLNDKIDIVLYPIDKTYDEFDTYEIYNLKPAILVNKKNKLSQKPDDEISFRDLSEQNIMMLDSDKMLSYFSSACKEFNINSNIRFENTDWEMIRNFVKLDLGIHLYTELYDKFPMFKDDDIIAKYVPQIFPNVKINIITKKNKIQSPIIEEFIKVLKQDISKL